MQDDKVINPQKVYNVQEAAKVLDINEQTLLDYLRSGKIAAQKIGEWKILGKNLMDFLSLNSPSTPERIVLVEDLNNTVEKLYAIYQEKNKEGNSYRMGIFLHQSINQYADEKTLEKVLADVKRHINYLTKNNE